MTMKYTKFFLTDRIVKFMKAFNVFILTFLLSAFSFVSCQNNGTPEKIKFSGGTQGTYYSITYYDSLNRNLQPQLVAFLKDFEQTASLWVPNSILCKVNRNEKVTLNKVFIDIYSKSEKIAKATNGAFDFTIGPLTSAWGFGFENKSKMTQQKIDSLLKLVGYQKVHLKNNKITKDNPAIRMDFNALAKGYSVDLVGQYLESLNIKNYLIDIGGEVIAKGFKPEDNEQIPWIVGIEEPTASKDDERKIFSKVVLENKALATSGNYRKYYEENGVRYSHTIDPKTGYPAKHNLLSASVLANECWEADGYATAFMVMGFEKAVEFLKTRPDIQVYFIYEKDGTFQSFVTPGFAKYMLK